MARRASFIRALPGPDAASIPNGIAPGGKPLMPPASKRHSELILPGGLKKCGKHFRSQSCYGKWLRMASPSDPAWASAEKRDGGILLSTPGRGWASATLASCALILLITGAAKVWSGLGTSKALAVADPILGISFGKTIRGVGLVEIAVAAHCLFRPARIFTNASLMAWLSTSFLVYRLGLWGMDWHKPCGCLGGLADALHLRPETADTLIKGLLAWLLVGSCWVLFGQRVHDARQTDSAKRQTITKPIGSVGTNT